jgi:hypothetical protein
VTVRRNGDGKGAYEMRGNREKFRALATGFSDAGNVGVLEITYAAVNHP